MNQVKEVLPFITLAESIQTSNKMFAFYLRKYATDRIYQNYKTQGNPVFQEIYPQLDGMIKKTDQLKRQLDGQLNLKTNLTDILNYAERIFAQADDQYRAQRFSSELSQSFQTAWKFYEMANYFNKLPEAQDKKRAYAKTKSDQISMKLGGNYHQNTPLYQTPPPTFQPQTQFPMYSQFQSPQNAHNPNGNANHFGKKKRIDPQKILAQTTAINELHNAVSELEFNRVHYAKDSIRKALGMIQKYQD